MPAVERLRNDVLGESEMGSAVSAVIEVSFESDRKKPTHGSTLSKTVYIYSKIAITQGPFKIKNRSHDRKEEPTAPKKQEGVSDKTVQIEGEQCASNLYVRLYVQKTGGKREKSEGRMIAGRKWAYALRPGKEREIETLNPTPKR